VIQWKTDSGETHEQKVGPGDTIYMPADVVEHQLLNTGSETIHMAVVGVPPPRRTPLR
jgi:mannose-6-phosphate isomerase-like protein (cupin superfamily)